MACVGRRKDHGAEHAVALIIVPRDGEWGSVPAAPGNELGAHRVWTARSATGLVYTNRQLVTQTARCKYISSNMLNIVFSATYRSLTGFCDANLLYTRAGWQ
jgi:hypothetical protein